MKIGEDKCRKAYVEYILNFASSVSHSKVLDIGCGMGDLTHYFCKRKNEVFGIDVVDYRQKKFKNEFKFIKTNGKRLPFPSGFFDFVVSFDVIEHVSRDSAFVDEISRVLKKEARVLILTPNRKRLSSRVRSFLGRADKFPLISPAIGFQGQSIHVREYTGHTLKNLFSKAGFKQIKIDYFWFGFRGKVNLGMKHFFLKSLSQYIILEAVK